MEGNASSAGAGIPVEWQTQFSAAAFACPPAQQQQQGHMMDSSFASGGLWASTSQTMALSDVGGAMSAARGGGQSLPRANSGVCKGSLGQYFGLGSETRRTATWVPDPYGVEIGGGDAPEGYEERWSLNVHAIDTRGAADKPGCTECRCDLYNVTVDEEGYAGGTLCCSDQARCRVEEGFVDGEPRVLFLRYTVMWVDWSDAAVVPVRIYILDVADDALLQGKSKPDCKVVVLQ